LQLLAPGVVSHREVIYVYILRKEDSENPEHWQTPVARNV
jgi:hypothetical protein